MLYTMKDKKDNKVYTLKSMDEVMLKDDKDLFVVKLDGSKLHTYDEFEKTAKKAFQTPTDESMFWLDEPGNPWYCWIEELDWLLDAGFNSFALIVENWSKALDRDSKEEKNELLSDFQNTCDYWAYEVVECSLGGEPKDFNIYLVG
ncbi:MULTISPECIES: hypothetical protein [Helicobacter]|uniref:Barstar (barnase inhibitor) domain-containing protein n=10 Tax=Helicobacteraceae TaxID=72293 RepID=T1DV94_9HELI|nr:MULTISPECIES: hypothetical protein [Helicobacter]BBB20369.1 hypothetical protein HC081234_15460 [Helicobacter cinaedi]GAD18543.1 hypothetical protein HFN_1955 [Helicobacter fennelliae MRY12-0050]STP07484.1 Uncharacterised protein [Helicobacter fennelliae]